MSQDTTNADVRFLTSQPDWSKSFAASWQCATTINTSRNGAEQRARLRSYAREGMAYVETAMDNAIFPVARAAARLEVQTMLIVPLWHYQLLLTGFLDTTSEVLVDTDGDAIWLGRFTVGEWACYHDDYQGVSFRKVVSITAPNKIEVSEIEKYPEIAPEPGDGGYIAPCVIMVKTDWAARFSGRRVNRHDHYVDVEEP